jgi:two-component system, chemotaxis family, CheB/CheR fusion protein
MPPSKIMTLENGRFLRLQERVGQPELSLIDVFFRSLAEELKERAIGIILSGTGRDGTLGAKAIKSETGIVIVQDPDTARYDGMPRSAIATGVANYVRPPQEMPATLIEYVRQSHGVTAEKRREMIEKHSSDMQRIFSIIRLRTKRDFSGYKLTTLKRRIERRMSVNRIESLSEYTQFLTDNPPETEALFKDLLINVTQFFRDPQAFDVLKKLLLERLSTKKDGETVRAWTAGCSTGEESYSLAILLQECVEQLGKYLEIQVFGTDIDADAIVTARAGIYPAAIAQDLGEERVRRFFVRTDSQLQIRKELREKLVFAVQDITNDSPFSRMDLISVRNVLIYLGGDLQRRLIPILHYALTADGILFLGPLRQSVNMQSTSGSWTGNGRSTAGRERRTFTSPCLRTPGGMTFPFLRSRKARKPWRGTRMRGRSSRPSGPPSWWIRRSGSSMSTERPAGSLSLRRGSRT